MTSIIFIAVVGYWVFGVAIMWGILARAYREEEMKSKDRAMLWFALCFFATFIWPLLLIYVYVALPFYSFWVRLPDNDDQS